MDFLTTKPIRIALIVTLGIMVSWVVYLLLNKVEEKFGRLSTHNDRKALKKVHMFGDWYSDLSKLCGIELLKKLKTTLGMVVTFVGVDGTISNTQYNIHPIESSQSATVDTYLEDMLMAVKIRINFTVGVNNAPVDDDTITAPLNANEYERTLVRAYLLNAVHDAIENSKVKVKKGDMEELRRFIEELNDCVSQNLSKIRNKVIGVSSEKIEEITHSKY